jgi:hypothetical protein
MDAIEETRCKSMDSDAPMCIKADFVTMEAIDEILTDRKRQVRTEMQENGDLKLDRSWQIVYPFYLRLSTVAETITLIGKGYLLTHTIESLSKKTLFVSGNTFYLNFKKLMGESPSEFHAHLQLEKRGAVEG